LLLALLQRWQLKTQTLTQMQHLLTLNLLTQKTKMQHLLTLKAQTLNFQTIEKNSGVGKIMLAPLFRFCYT
jgi:hypothetical protein